ncbi:MAG: DUF2203 domain-containing protein, partial [Planctomycetes bacterium]|nr:DUF2203 domain-containing protein [Planctomycetota bacterium]
MPTRLKESLSAEEVIQRAPLLERIVRDFTDCYERRKKNREFLDEISIIAKKFNSPEIDETRYRLQRDVAELNRELESYEREIRALGGVLKDRERGLIYFYSIREDRKIYLVWDHHNPQIVSWH